MRIVILYSHLSGYTAACQRALQEFAGAELLVIHWPVDTEAPFKESIFIHIDHRYEKTGLTLREMYELVIEFDPTAIIVSGWMDQEYLAICRKMRRHGTPVIANCDTQWQGGLRQYIATLVAPYYLQSAIDIIWVTGERQRQFARRLGYKGNQCWSGNYSCDWDQFALKKPRSLVDARPAFLYVGRLIERKGLDTLLEAYRLYRANTSPVAWELWIAGTGPMASELEGMEGVRTLGFVQPDELPNLFHKVGAFVLPSRVEPWGVVLHEATTAGLPVIASHVCGAAVHLLTEGHNGYIFEAGNAEHLNVCLERVASAPSKRWEEMSMASYQLSQQFTPELWARTLVENLSAWTK